MRRIVRYSMVVLALLVSGFVLYQIVQFGKYVSATVQQYDAQVARRSDYARTTTPLSSDVAHDLCDKFEISSKDRRCQPGAIVYGPDFFPVINSYLRALPKADATFQTVYEKLGAYLVGCEKPDKDGIYACRYDLVGDDVYPIGILFMEDGEIYDIIINTGSS